MFEIKYYQRSNGKQPFIDWLEGLRGRAIIRTRIDRLKLGDMGRCRSVGGEVMELKIDFGPGYRCYFGKIGKTVVLLLCGGDKGSQERGIERAKLFFQEYRSEHNEK